MATVALTGDNFEEYVSKPGTLVVDWWAPWCGPCRMFAPIFDEASDRYPDVTFGKINTDEQSDLAESFSIQSIPTLMIFRDQVLVFARPGVVPGSALDQLVTRVKALDMDEVRKELAAQRAEANGHADDHDEHADCPDCGHETQADTGADADPAPVGDPKRGATGGGAGG
jgi:thioredoxin